MSFRSLGRLAAACAVTLASACGPEPTVDEWRQTASPEFLAERRAATAAVGVIMPDVYTTTGMVRKYSDDVVRLAAMEPMNGGVAFLGDSITEVGDWVAAYPDLAVRNYGISGDTRLGLERRLGMVIEAKPDRVFLLLPVNEVSLGVPSEEVLQNAARLLDMLIAGLPEADIYVQSTLPRAGSFDEHVRAVNAGLILLAEERGLTFIDLHSAFVTEDGGLDPVTTYDNLHLTQAGYERWRAIINDCVYGRC